MHSETLLCKSMLYECLIACWNNMRVCALATRLFSSSGMNEPVAERGETLLLTE